MKIIVKSIDPMIYGTSTINHKVRIKCNLTCDEIVVLMYLIKFRESRKKNFSAKETDHLEKDIGFSLKEAAPVIRSLKSKGFCTSENKVVFLTDKISEITGDVENQFNELWEKYNYKINKSGALSMFTRAIAIVDLKYLYKKLEVYNQWLDLPKNKGLAKMHLSTWLNPDNRRFDDEYIIPKTNEDEDKFVI